MLYQPNIINFRSEVEAEDEVDSDFSIDENDEPVSDVDDPDAAKPQKRGRLITKAYKVTSFFSSWL